MSRSACILFLLFASALCVLQFAFRRLPWQVVGVKKPSPVKGFHHHNLTEYKEYSMARFLSTYEPVWLYNTTANAGRECEVDEMKMINRLSVILMRSYYENKTKVSAYIQGIFDPSDKKRMFITIPSTAKAIVQSVTEELMYLSKKIRCAVIRITVLPGLVAAGPEIIYDLRVRNFSLSRGPSKGCIKKFSKLAPTSSRIYKSTCQNILSNKLEQHLLLHGKEIPKHDHLR
uniref:Putative group i salivary lipocalin n=1 Tax=Rhipicephalus pulchellus TaxID=72859 RepID=L7LR63_RHIPC